MGINTVQATTTIAAKPIDPLRHSGPTLDDIPLAFSFLPHANDGQRLARDTLEVRTNVGLQPLAAERADFASTVSCIKATNEATFYGICLIRLAEFPNPMLISIILSTKLLRELPQVN